jgi:hypothetical protein
MDNYTNYTLDRGTVIVNEELDNEGQKELLINALWDDVAGLTLWKLNILVGEFRLELIDPQEVLVHRSETVGH